MSQDPHFEASVRDSIEAGFVRHVEDLSVPRSNSEVGFVVTTRNMKGTCLGLP
jgi:hypothetical protein